MHQSRAARSRRLSRPLAVGLVLCALLGACSEERADRTAAPASRSPGSASPATPSEAPTASVEDGETPIVVAVHPSRQRVRLTSELVSSLREGAVDDWAQLGQPAGPLRVAPLAEVPAAPDAVAVVPASDVSAAVSVATVDGVDPLRDPEDYPLTVTGPPPGAVTTVTVTGDVMLGRRVGDVLAAAEDPAAVLRPMSRRLAAADLTIGNLESTLSRAGAPRQGDDSFGAAPEVRRGLRRAGFDVLSLANNHTGDYGPEALVRTVRRVRGGGFLPVGAGRHLAAASAPVLVERNGVRFGIVAFDAIGETPAAGPGSPGAFRLRMDPRTGPLVQADLDRVVAVVRSLRSQVDVVLVLPHWGTQYTHRTVRDQRLVARTLVRAGADLVVGGHPHWVQGVERVGDGLVVYSLGNFVFDMDFMRKTQEGAVLEATFWDGRLKSVRLVPVVIGRDFAPRVARGARGRSILEDIVDASDRPLRGTHTD